MMIFWQNKIKRERQKENRCFSLLLLLIGQLLSQGCVPEPRGAARLAGAANASNGASAVPVGYGKILRDNPIILSGNEQLSPTTNLNNLLSSEVDFIKDDGDTLEQSCTASNESIDSCFSVLLDPNATALTNTSRRWSYNASSEEFLQVHTFGHELKLNQRFMANTESLFESASPNTSPGAQNYRTSIPAYLFDDQAFWNVLDPSASPVTHRTLYSYPGCDLEDNAAFSAADFSLCYGYDSEYNQLKFAHDPTIIYHETGHSYIYIMSNARNMISHKSGGDPVTPPLLRANLGTLFYDEAGAINEGLADYFSYYMNKRAHFAEWALGRLLKSSRPMTEEDDSHRGLVSSDTFERLSYPFFLNYDPNDPENPIEDIHNAGMITSHFLVALTEDFVDRCSLTHTQASDHVMGLIYETLAELGDLTAMGNDHADPGIYHVNLGPDDAYEWSQKVNPINYRRFFQVFARYTLATTNLFNSTFCAGSVYPKDDLEDLLDHYGLLLFKNYNDDGNSESLGILGVATNQKVTEANRLKSVLVTKDAIKFTPKEGVPQVFIVDSRSDIKKAMAGMQASGQIGTLSPQISTSFRFNNGNADISPGEVVGLALNLYNNSNTPLGGVQILANDWDHVKGTAATGYSICNNFDDEFPIEGEGAADLTGDNNSTPGDCAYISRNNGATTDDLMAPICTVQMQKDGVTVWSTQDELMEEIGLEAQECLSGASNTYDCFIRAIKGADHAFYSKISPHKTWTETLVNAKGEPPSYSTSNLVFFEVSPNTPPGTTFDCRFRVRFTNCEECWHDPSLTNGDDYRDFEFSGGEPFKILHFQFTVID